MTHWTPAQVKEARHALGLSCEKLAAALRMGIHGGRQVRRWESGECQISGPATVAIEYLLLDRYRSLARYRQQC